ncbi:MAG: response regulator transcription factor [Pleurocapsa sp.]
MIRILIVDDQNFTRQALQVILETEEDFEIVGQASNGVQAFELMDETHADIIIVDLEMPEMNGLTLTKMVCQSFPETKVIILSSNDDDKNINTAVEAGARGYLLKTTSAPEIVDTIRAIQRGYFQLGPGLFEKLLSHLISDQKTNSENLSQLEAKYSLHLAQLEQKIALENQSDRLKLYSEIEQQINNLKLEFREGLETFQDQVSSQIQMGLDTAKHQFNNINIDNDLNNIIEKQIYARHLEQQRYINNLFSGSKQSLRKLEHKVNLMRSFIIALVVIFCIQQVIIVLSFI